MSETTPFTNDDVEQILRIVDRLSEVEVRFESGDLKLHVRKFSAAGPTAELPSPATPRSEAKQPQASAPQPAPTSSSPGKEVPLPPGSVAIRAPMLGTFYRSPSPAEPPFVEVGQRVAADDPICLIEIMKLFNTVNAGVDATIVSIAVENGTMVANDDILFVVKVD